MEKEGKEVIPKIHHLLYSKSLGYQSSCLILAYSLSKRENGMLLGRRQ